MYQLDTSSTIAKCSLRIVSISMERKVRRRITTVPVLSEHEGAYSVEDTIHAFAKQTICSNQFEQMGGEYTLETHFMEIQWYSTQSFNKISSYSIDISHEFNII